MHATEQIRRALLAHTQCRSSGTIEEAGMLATEQGELFSVLVRPSNGTPSRIGIVVCHSWFELRMLQRTEFDLLRAAAAVGFPGRYVQAPGAGDSAGAVTSCTIAARVAAALSAAEQLRRDVPELDEVAFVGARLGGAIAVLAGAQEGRNAPVILWDPCFSSGDYWRQSKRFARVVAALGRQRVEDVDPILARGEEAFLVGYRVTPELRRDLAEIDRVASVGRVSRAALVIGLNDGSLAPQRREVLRLAEQVDGHRLGPPKARNLIRLRIEDAQRAVDPSVSWLQGLV